MNQIIPEYQQWSHEKLLRYAGMFTWICVGIPLLLTPFYMGESLDLLLYGIWWVAYLAFGKVYWLLARRFRGRSGSQTDIFYLLVLSMCSLIISESSQSGLGGFLNIVLAGALPWFVRLKIGALWLFMINIVLLPVFIQYQGISAMVAVLATALFLGFSAFMFVTALVGLRQYKARDELRRVNAELRATQALLAESTRIGERLRISRELHDLVGHHLTALSLNLEVANHLVTGKASKHVDQAQSLARLLLADVREVVSNLRDDDNLDINKALKRLVEGVPLIEVHLEVSEQVQLNDPELAHVILRSVQELITNCVKHAGAKNLWITLNLDHKQISLVVRDDGRGNDDDIHGNGLNGLKERLLQYGGKMKVSTEPNNGFKVQVCMPTTRAALLEDALAGKKGEE